MRCHPCTTGPLENSRLVRAPGHPVTRTMARDRVSACDRWTIRVMRRKLAP